jgi:1-deoxy-D-xylulose-5-phosphate reductoisomerase
MNAANEEAVQAFIDERISLSDVPLVIESVMNQHETAAVTDLDSVLSADRGARATAQASIRHFAENSRAKSVA